MTVRALVATTLVGLAALLSACDSEGASDAAPPGPRPHVVLIVCDTLRADALDLYGYERTTAPELAAWAADALVFEHATASSNWTRPAMFSVFTGRHPDAGRQYTKEAWLPRDVPVVAELLRGAGYETVGITTNVYLLPEWGADRGFDVFEPMGRTGAGTTPVDMVVDAAARRLAARDAGRPLFLYVHLMDSHQPYDPPAAYRRWSDPDYEGPAHWKLDDFRRMRGEDVDTRLPSADRAFVRSLYDGEVLRMDAGLAELRALVGAHLDDRPVVTLLTADHGELFGEGPENRYFHGHSTLPGVVHVPMVLHGAQRPGTGASGRVATRVGLIDVAPTLLDVASIPAPEGMDGRSLLSAGPGHDYIVYRHRDEDEPLANSDLAVLRDGVRAEHVSANGDAAWRLVDAVTGEPLDDPALLDELSAAAADWYRESLERRKDTEAAAPMPHDVREQLDALGYAGEDG